MKVYLDIAIAGEQIGRIVCELYNDKAPKAVENFHRLCVGSGSVGGIHLTYKRSCFHRVIRNFMIQGGDLVFGKEDNLDSDKVGLGGCSIYATEEEIKDDTKELQCHGLFEDENVGEFDEPFLLAMANTGSPNTNSSQFFITTYPSPHLTGKHSIFGRVIHGKSVVRTIEYGKVDKEGTPENLVVIEDCGDWDETMSIPLYNASNSTIGEDIYEEYPDDDTHFDSEDFAAAYNASNIIKDSGSALFKIKDYQNSYYKYMKALKYVNTYIPEQDVDEKHCLLFIELKKKLYLNICLALFNLKDYDESMKYGHYLLELDSVDDKDKAKAYYRIGNSLFAKKRYDEALKNYRLCRDHNPDDNVIGQKIEKTEDILEKEKERTKKNISKFFR